MKRNSVHNVDDITQENQEQINRKFDSSTNEDDYEFLNNIDFLKHIDISDYEKESFTVKNEAPAQKEDIKVNVDYLDDLAFFDELDYFDQLDKSLEQELKGLDHPFVGNPIKPKRRWFKRHSDGLLLGAGIGVLLLLGGGVVGLVGTHLSKTGESYAGSEYAKAEVNSNLEAGATPGDVTALTSNDQKVAESTHKSESLIQRRDENQAARTVDPRTTDKPAKTEKPKDPKDKGEVSNQASEQELKDFYSDSVLIGNSLTEDLKRAGGVSTAKYLAIMNLNVSDALTRKFVGKNKQTIPQALAGIKCKKIFIMFGVNELGWPSPKIFGERYEEVIKEIKKIQPDATIYIESILPCSKELGEQDKECKKSNIERFNKVIEQTAKKTGCTYLDLTKSVADSEGYLPKEAATDGMHPKLPYNRKWISYMYNLVK